MSANQQRIYLRSKDHIYATSQWILVDLSGFPLLQPWKLASHHSGSLLRAVLLGGGLTLNVVPAVFMMMLACARLFYGYWSGQLLTLQVVRYLT